MFSTGVFFSLASKVPLLSPLQLLNKTSCWPSQACGLQNTCREVHLAVNLSPKPPPSCLGLVRCLFWTTPNPSFHSHMKGALDPNAIGNWNEAFFHLSVPPFFHQILIMWNHNNDNERYKKTNDSSIKRFCCIVLLLNLFSPLFHCRC